MKVIWIINHYAGPMREDKGGRHYWMAKYLNQKGYHPVVICCNAKHETPEYNIEFDGIWDYREAEEINTEFVYIKARTYVGNGKGRVFNIIDFYKNLLKSYSEIAERLGKPQVIIASSIHPLTPIAGIKLGKKMGIPCICEYRDLWPDELICMNSISENGIPAKVLRSLEHWSYKKADALIFTMEGATQYIRDQKWDTENGGDVDLSKSIYINNGVDLNTYLENISKFRLDDSDLDDERKFKVVYTGNINFANGIDKVFEIAHLLQDIPEIVFLLYGAGNEVETVKEKIKSEGIKNVIYKGAVNKQYVPYILSKSGVNLLNYLNGDLFRYGCSNNKLFEYMASGKPILCTINMKYSIIKKYGCGEEIGGDIEKMAEFIRMMYKSKDKQEIYRNNCLSAIHDFDFKTYADRLDNLISKLISI